MNTLLLLAVLLSPIAAVELPSADAASAEAPPAMTAPSRTATANRQPPTEKLVLLPHCAPPALGDWRIRSDCLMVGDRVAPADVLVEGGSTLYLANGASLDIDLATRRLMIDATSRVLIGAGARIY